MNKKIIPGDSVLHLWLKSLAITEIPVSYQILGGLSLIGAVLRRNIWVDQIDWRIFPNLNCLLIGPSGVGKDTIINAICEVVDVVGSTPIVAGRTIEGIYDQMLGLGDPACCVIPAREVSAFFGGKDYQANMVQDVTDLLSNGPYHDVSTKSGGKKKIPHPTVTMLAGSTREWLHKAMPDGSLEGGLWPRFVIVDEEYGSKHVPLLKYSNTRRENLKADQAKGKFIDWISGISGAYNGEMLLLHGAVDTYTNWYINRMGMFSELVKPYANRSRDQVLRLAMLCGISRGQNFVEAADVQFAIEVMKYIATRIDLAMQPPTLEGRISVDVFELLPRTTKQLMADLQRKYSMKMIRDTVMMLVESGQIKLDKDGWIKS